MATLKVGDKVVLITKQSYSLNKYCTFDEVVRVTKTQAVLSSGVKVKIDSSWNHYKGDLFADIKDWRKEWQLSTPEIEAEAKTEELRQTIARWFDKQKFTDEQKAKIYEMFNQEAK